MSEPPVILVDGLRTRFGAQLLHDDLELEVRRGEVFAIVGGSGAGKSVLLHEILGLVRPERGRIEVLGRELARLSDAERRALQARQGVLFQDGALFSSLTVGQNIQAPLRERLALPPTLLDELAGLKLALVGLARDACHKYPSELSGGMRKRAGLARALALEPEILFLDEPTAGLDPIAAAEFDRLIGGLQRSLGLTVVMVTHDLDSLMAIGDRVAALVDRRALVGTLEELRNLDHPWLRAYFHGPRGRAAAAPGIQGR
ncbi:MAG TPA: ATP-binding cassette domain-containing protein [Geminicoccaceae bacterium]|nr:ATP-binding cassette domain-containing protein [Geminicoccaceae bacterium]